MGSIGLILVLLIALIVFLLYKIKKGKSNHSLERNTKSGNNLNNDKKQIKIELEKIRSKHLKNLINYYVTLFSQTELDNQADRNKIAEIYPQTLSRESFEFTFLFTNYDSILVNNSILEMISELGDVNATNSISEPFLKFEEFVKNEAELEARSISEDFFRGKI